MNDTTTDNHDSSNSTTANTTSSSTSSSSSTPITVESIRWQFSSWIVRIQQNVSIETIRPLTVFLGLRNATPTTTDYKNDNNNNDDDVTTFSNPPPSMALLLQTVIAPNAYTTPNGSTYRSTYDMIQSRMQDNLTYYRSNYVFIVAMTSLVIVLMHPSMIVTGLVVYGLYVLHLYLIRHEVMLVRSSHLSIQTLLTVPQRLYFFGSIALLLILVTCIIPTLIIIIISSMIVLTHAILRNSHNTVSSDMSSSSSQRSSTKSYINHHQNTGNNSIHNDEVDPLLSSV